MTTTINYSPEQHFNSATMSEANKWLKRFDALISKDPSDDSLNNESLAKEMMISERQLFRKMKAFTGKSPQQYLRQYRMNQAMKYLRDGRYRTVKETAHAVGYLNVSYFISLFEEAFGAKPLHILQEEGWR